MSSADGSGAPSNLGRSQVIYELRARVRTSHPSCEGADRLTWPLTAVRRDGLSAPGGEWSDFYLAHHVGRYDTSRCSVLDCSHIPDMHEDRRSCLARSHRPNLAHQIEVRPLARGGSPAELPAGFRLGAATGKRRGPGSPNRRRRGAGPSDGPLQGRPPLLGQYRHPLLGKGAALHLGSYVP